MISGAGALDDTTTDPMTYLVADKVHAGATYDYKVLAYQDFCSVRQYSLDSNLPRVLDVNACLYRPETVTDLDYNYTDLGGNFAPPQADSLNGFVTLDWTALPGATNAAIEEYNIYDSRDGYTASVGFVADITSTTITIDVNAIASATPLDYQIAAIDTKLL